MQSLRQIADENDIILIYDEVQTGVGVTGKMWAHQHFSNDDCSASQCKCGDGLLAVPDIISFGKKHKFVELQLVLDLMKLMVMFLENLQESILLGVEV